MREVACFWLERAGALSVSPGPDDKGSMHAREFDAIVPLIINNILTLIKDRVVYPIKSTIRYRLQRRLLLARLDLRRCHEGFDFRNPELL